MYINNKTLDDFGISVVTIFDLQQSNYKLYSQNWNLNQISPLHGIHKEDFRNLDIEFLFESTSKEELIKKISIFTEEVKQCTIKRNNLFYDIEMDGSLSSSQINSFAMLVSHKFIVIDVYEDEKSITTTKNTTININSPKPCYANLELSASTSIISYTVTINDTEIVVKNIKGNETVYIGSGKVVAGGKSKINDVDMFEFPILKPGVNNITVDRDDVNLKIKYNERW